MLIVPPSYEILDGLDRQGLAVRIEFCGRICYKSEDRIDRESALPFVRKITEHGHNSVLEMGVVSLLVAFPERSMEAELFAAQPRYLHIDATADNTLLVTGSVRAFREMLLFHPTCRLVRAMTGFLASRHPYFFDTILPPGGLTADPAITVRKVPLGEIDALPPDLRIRHRHIAVKFIVNRAVTHEIVRHRPCSFLQESQRYCRYDDEVVFIRPEWADTMSNFDFDRMWGFPMIRAEADYKKALKFGLKPQQARAVLPNSTKTELIAYASLPQWRHMFNLRCSPAADPEMTRIMRPLRDQFKQKYPEAFKNEQDD